MVHAQKKVAEIEAAFFQWFQRPIRVQFQLEVGTEAKSVSPAMVNPSSPPPPAASKLNGNSPVASLRDIPSVSREALPRERNPPPAAPSANEVNFTPAIATPSAQATPVPENLATPEQTYSDNELHKAAETFAKLFDGEIVQLTEEPEPKNPKIEIKTSQESPEELHLIQQIESKASLNIVSTAGSPRILGRPDSSQGDDDEDLPF